MADRFYSTDRMTITMSRAGRLEAWKSTSKKATMIKEYFNDDNARSDVELTSLYALSRNQINAQRDSVMLTIVIQLFPHYKLVHTITKRPS